MNSSFYPSEIKEIFLIHQPSLSSKEAKDIEYQLMNFLEKLLMDRLDQTITAKEICQLALLLRKAFVNINANSPKTFIRVLKKLAVKIGYDFINTLESLQISNDEAMLKKYAEVIATRTASIALINTLQTQARIALEILNSNKLDKTKVNIKDWSLLSMLAVSNIGTNPEEDYTQKKYLAYYNKLNSATKNLIELLRKINLSPWCDKSIVAIKLSQTELQNALITQLPSTQFVSFINHSGSPVFGPSQEPSTPNSVTIENKGITLA